MAYQVLARKWRPKQFEDVVGQEHVTRTLQNALKLKQLAHAYLFTGTRGVGKTSIARLFSKAIRCESKKSDQNPCLVCSLCLDIDSGSSLDYLEIDGASNNSVDDVRALIENVQYLPTRGQHKIYVIDEVHMLSVAAFNALLKTLEEPPLHTIFILATTDPHKLLGTVVSRCQRYDFKNVPADLISAHINNIARIENITFSENHLIKKLAELGRGSVRDTLSILDQVLGLASEKVITEEIFNQALGLVGPSSLRQILNSLILGTAEELNKIYKQLIQDNIDLKKLSEQIIEGFYEVINRKIENTTIGQQPTSNQESSIGLAELFWIHETLVKDSSWALSSMNPEKVFHIVLQKICLRRKMILSGGQDEPLRPTTLGENNTPTEMFKSDDKKSWDEFLNYLTKLSPTTATNLRYGNLLHEINLNSTSLTFEIAFPEESLVFKDYIEQKDVLLNLKNHLAGYFKRDVSQIVFKTMTLTTELVKDRNFKTKIQLEIEEKTNLVEQKKQKILSNPFVGEAEKLFNSKIDKIILND